MARINVASAGFEDNRSDNDPSGLANRICCVSHRCHSPRKRGIQYSGDVKRSCPATAYRIARFHGWWHEI